MHYVYVLVSENRETYTGYTNDLRTRMKKHASGDTKTTRGKEWTLVYYESYISAKDARYREQRLKDGRAKNELMKLISNSIEELFPT